jgi:voltage-gated potassium channel
VWAALEAENVPRLTSFFIVVLLAGGAAMYFIEKGSNEQFKTPEDGLWWSLVTLTTIGYGDKFPTSTVGRLLAFVVVIFGIGLVGTVTAKIASALVERRIREGKGLTDAEGFKGHLVILGWKADLHLLLQGMLSISPDLLQKGVVLVNQAGEMPNEQLRARFPGIVYVHGDSIDPQVLDRARVRDASKALVLVDEAVDRSDQEQDARTVMMVMNIENMNSNVYTCAEVLDPKYVAYLRLAHCDEVILSREFDRLMILGASLSTGFSPVIQSLMRVGDAQVLYTAEIPADFVGGNFSDLAVHFRGKGGYLLVGLLENTGQSLTMKREALRHAQKTDDVALLVENLQAVKTLENNRPVLNPPDDYPVKPHAMAIVIGRNPAAERA